MTDAIPSRPPLATQASRFALPPVPAQEVRVTVSPVARTAPSGPHKRFVDVHLDGASVATVRSLAFRNHYAAFLTVKARVSTSADPDPAHPAAAASVRSHRWIDLVVDRRLMSDPHYEDDAQALHVVQLPDAITVDRDVCLRAYFHNPSPRWVGVDVQLRNLAAFARGDVASIRAAMVERETGARRGEPSYERQSPTSKTKAQRSDDEMRLGTSSSGTTSGTRSGTTSSGTGTGPAGESPLDPGLVAGARAACDDLVEAFRAAAAARAAHVASRGGGRIARGSAGSGADQDDEIAYLA